MKGDGYPMGTHRVQRVEKAVTIHFRKWNARAWRHFVFQNALDMLCDSISTGGQYVTLDNKIKCLSVAVYPGTINTETNQKY
jgi:hypothetical protein